MRLDKEAAGTGIAHGTAVNVQRRKIFGIGKRIADRKRADFVTVKCVVVLIDGINDKRTLLQKGVGVIHVDRIAGFRPVFRQRMHLMTARTNHRDCLFLRIQHMNTAGSTVDVQCIVTHAFHIAVAQYHLSRKTECMDTVRICRFQTGGTVGNTNAEIVKREVLTARTDGCAEAGGSIDDDILQKEAAAVSKVENRVAVDFIADIDLVTDNQLRGNMTELQPHQMITDHVIIKSNQTLLLGAVGRDECLLYWRIVIRMKRIIGRTELVKAVGRTEMLKAGDRKFVINLQIGSARVPIDGGNPSCRADGVVRIEKEIGNRHIVAVIEVKHVIVGGNGCCRIKMCKHRRCSAENRQILCAADGKCTADAVGPFFELHRNRFSVIDDAVKDRLQSRRTVHTGIGMNPIIG